MSINDSPPIIYVDFDDVLCQTACTFIDVVEREFGRRYAFGDIHSFNLQESFHLNSEEYEHLMRLVHDPEILRTMEPMPGALGVLNTWYASGVKIWVVTGRPPTTESVCRDWLTGHAVPYERIIFVDKYARAHEPDVNVQVLSPTELISMNFCLVVEDALAMIQFLVEQTRVPVAVLDRPWNQDLELSHQVLNGQLTRCADWAAVAQVFTSRVRCSS